MHAVTNAEEGSIIVLCSDVVPDALDLVKKLKEEESNSLYKL
jgi:cyanophycin synthetase